MYTKKAKITPELAEEILDVFEELFRVQACLSASNGSLLTSEAKKWMAEYNKHQWAAYLKAQELLKRLGRNHYSSIKS